MQQTYTGPCRPWGEQCLITGNPVTQNITAEYIDQLNSHKRLKQIVIWVMPDIEQFEEEIEQPPLHLEVGETMTATTTATTNIINSHYGKTN